MITTSLASASSFENMTPSGPQRNNVFALMQLRLQYGQFFGDYTVDYNPYPLDNYGISKFSTTGWLFPTKVLGQNQ
jgi:hypothetical protein